MWDKKEVRLFQQKAKTSIEHCDMNFIRWDRKLTCFIFITRKKVKVLLFCFVTSIIANSSESSRISLDKTYTELHNSKLQNI